MIRNIITFEYPYWVHHPPHHHAHHHHHLSSFLTRSTAQTKPQRALRGATHSLWRDGDDVITLGGREKERKKKNEYATLRACINSPT